MDTRIDDLPTSQHFRLERLSEGVYAAIHRSGGWAIGNAGIVDLGDRTLVFDTTYSPQAGADLRAAAEALFGRRVGLVVNTTGTAITSGATRPSTQQLPSSRRQRRAARRDHAR